MSKSHLNGQGPSDHHVGQETDPAGLDPSEEDEVKECTAYSYVRSHVDNNSIGDWVLDQTTSRDFFQTICWDSVKEIKTKTNKKSHRWTTQL